MNDQKVFRKPPSPEQHALADALHRLRPQLEKNTDKQCNITLDALKSRNKNAVGIHRNWLKFMVADWSSEAEAKELGFATGQDLRRKRLLIFKLGPGGKKCNLSLEQVDQQKDFFTRLIEGAEAQAYARLK